MILQAEILSTGTYFFLNIFFKTFNPVLVRLLGNMARSKFFDIITFRYPCLGQRDSTVRILFCYSDIISNDIQSTLVISKSKGPFETLRDIRNSTYQMCRIEENTIRTTNFHKRTCNLSPLVSNIY